MMLVLAGCSIPGYSTYQYNALSELTRDEYAIVSMMYAIKVDEVDGKTVDHRRITHLMLLPGKHRIKTHYYFESLGTATEGKPLELEFYVKGNHTYMIKFKLLSDKWSVYIEDVTHTRDHEPDADVVN